jgi:hypothetical protein
VCEFGLEKIVKIDLEMTVWYGRRAQGRTRYQPVGLPVFPILEWEVRTKRTFGGAILEYVFV